MMPHWRVGAIGALVFGAIGVNRQGMVSNGKTFGFGYRVLAFFNFSVIKLFNLAAVQAHQVVMVLSFVQLIHRLARLKIAAVEQARLLKLREYPVDRGQANV